MATLEAGITPRPSSICHIMHKTQVHVLMSIRNWFVCHVSSSVCKFSVFILLVVILLPGKDGEDLGTTINMAVVE